MKILEIGTGYTSIPARMGAATEVVVEEITRAFLKAGIDVEIVDIDDPDRRPTDLPIRGVAVPRWICRADIRLGIMHKLKRITYSILLARLLKKLIAATSEELIVHFHNQYNMFVFLCLTPKRVIKRARLAYTNHSHIWSGRWKEIERTVWMRYFQEIYCLRRADIVFVLNTPTLNHLVERLHIPASRIHLIVNGVNTDTYHPLRAEASLHRRQVSKWECKQLFFQAGSVCPRKNQLASVMLLAPIMRANRNVIFAYAGGIIDEDYKARIDAFIRDEEIEEQVFYIGEKAPGEELN